MPLRAASAETEVPKRAAMAPRVSPGLTVYVWLTALLPPPLPDTAGCDE